MITTHRHAMFQEMGTAGHAALDAMDTKFGPWVAKKMASAEYRHWFAANSTGAIVAGAGMWLVEWSPHPLDLTQRRGYIMNVYTQRDYRNHGLAKRLTTTILGWCRENQIETATLHASDAGRPIYESLGFQATNEMQLQLSNSTEGNNESH